MKLVVPKFDKGRDPPAKRLAFDDGESSTRSLENVKGLD
jgi:hypothetical protein